MRVLGCLDSSHPFALGSMAGCQSGLLMRYSIFLPFFMLLLALCAACTAPLPAAPMQEQQKIVFYIDKLADQTFVDSYGDNDNPKVWYTAAEKLGAIGAPAIPALVRRLSTTDPYELMLALYALMLASQDPIIMLQTGDDYLQLDTVLTPQTNPVNLKLAQQWCRRHTAVCSP